MRLKGLGHRLLRIVQVILAASTDRRQHLVEQRVKQGLPRCPAGIEQAS